MALEEKFGFPYVVKVFLMKSMVFLLLGFQRQSLATLRFLYVFWRSKISTMFDTTRHTNLNNSNHHYISNENGRFVIQLLLIIFLSDGIQLKFCEQITRYRPSISTFKGESTHRFTLIKIHKNAIIRKLEIAF